MGSRDEPSPVQAQLQRCGGIQCGFCIPGIVVTAEAYLKTVERPTRDQIREANSGNLCRCTGYEKIVDAIVQASAGGSNFGDLMRQETSDAES